MPRYDMLFQDVGIIWYKNPPEYFHDKSLPVYSYEVFIGN